jgi:hypothetical protein
MNTTAEFIEHFKEISPVLSDAALSELRTFTDYLADREIRRRKLEESVLKAEQETPVRFKTVEEAMQAIRDEAGI